MMGCSSSTSLGPLTLLRVLSLSKQMVSEGRTIGLASSVNDLVERISDYSRSAGAL
jgi:hypothetical protein